MTENPNVLRQFAAIRANKAPVFNNAPQTWGDYFAMLNRNLQQNFPTNPRDPNFSAAIKNVANTFAPMGITVFHGSPHKFDAFDMSKIGTGEGKQQQGVGLYFSEMKKVAQKYADKESMKRGMDSGNIYSVDLPDSAVAKMINYDAPLAAQPQAVRDAIAPQITPQVMMDLRGYHGWENPTDAPMAAILDVLDMANGARYATSAKLKELGIPGIRYLDGGSRGTGAGTSNFVVFDDKLPKILGRE